MDAEREYLTECITNLEIIDEAARSQRQNCTLTTYRNVLAKLDPVKKIKPDLSIVARPGAKLNRDGLPKSFTTGMDTEEHLRHFRMYCATNGYTTSDEKMAIFSMTLAKLESQWYETCSAEKIEKLETQFEARFRTTNHQNKARKDFNSTTWDRSEKPSTFLMKLNILGGKAKESTE
jgi:hypothetical protein